MRTLTQLERTRAGDLATIPNTTIGLFEVTETQITKSIVDANASIRLALSMAGVHDFEAQPQGSDAKVVLTASWLDGDQETATQVSLYRPKTKQGDPRFWPYRMAERLIPGHVIAFIVASDRICFLDLADPRFEDARDALLDEYGFEMGRSAAAEELLDRLRQLATRGPIPSPRRGDTAVGAAIEHALGIAQNSSRSPDYRGIEIKGKRRSAQVRSTLFACVPDWRISACKSSADILRRYGYERDGLLRLNCQVNAGRANAQGLKFMVDYDRAEVCEVHVGDGPTADVAKWPFERLMSYLANKHRETFWVDARAERTATGELFTLTSVEHTQTPRLAAFPYLIDEDVVSMDHLIKRNRRGRVTERGPLFKIARGDLDLLFPTRRTYALR